MSNKSDYRKRLNELTSQAQAQDWVVQLTQNGHVKFIPPDKEREIVIAPGTTTDHRTSANVLSQLRRSGFRDR